MYPVETIIVEDDLRPILFSSEAWRPSEGEERELISIVFIIEKSDDYPARRSNCGRRNSKEYIQSRK